jgi:lysozyme family protein
MENLNTDSEPEIEAKTARAKQARVPPNAKKSKSDGGGWSTVTTTLLAAVFGLLGTGVGAVLQGVYNLQLERQKFESSLIAKALEPDDQDKRAKQLDFYIKIGLIKDERLIAGLKPFLDNPTEIPQVSTPSGSFVRPKYDDATKSEIQSLFDSCQINPEKLAEVRAISRTIAQNKSRYLAVSKAIGIPWEAVGILHFLENGLTFDRHLHNGDPLTARTVNVPSGRPVSGNPPFTWEESAIDALRLRKLDTWTDWSDAGILYKLEQYNGFGYRLHNIKSPYLWSYSNHYLKGGYVADGAWSDSKVFASPGAAVLLKALRTAEVNRGTAEGEN